MPCTDDCSCKNYTCMMDAATSVCGYIQLEDQAIEKHCKCILCEQNSNDDSDDTDSRECFFYHSLRHILQQINKNKKTNLV